MEIGDFFARYTKAYDNIMWNLSYYRTLMNLHFTALKNCSKVLESGCGPGRLVIKLLEQGKEVYAIDSNKVALDLIGLKTTKYKFGLNLYCQDLSKPLPFDDESFDGVSSMLVLPFMEFPIEYLKEHIRILKKGGILVISGPDEDSKQKVNEIISKWKKDHEQQNLLTNLINDWEDYEKYTRENVNSNVKNWFSVEQVVEILQKNFNMKIKEKDTNPIYFGTGYFIVAVK